MLIPQILVLGATGKIGGALVDALLPDQSARRLKIIAGVRRSAAARQFEQRGIETRTIDLDVAESQGLEPVVRAFEGIDRVFMVTGYDVKMLAQSKAVVDGARAVGASHLVHIGVHARSDTTIVHFAWHQMIEAYIERSGLGYTHLHPSSFMQNLLLLRDMAGIKSVITHYIGNARTAWIDTSDIAETAAVVLREPATHAGQTYALSTEAASMHEIASLLAAVTGESWRYEPQEPEAFYQRMTALGADPVYMACVRNVFERTRNGSLPEAAETFDTTERLTGRAPVSLRAFIDKHRSAFA